MHLLIATVFWTTVTVVGCSTNGDNTSTPDASDDGTTTIFDSGTTDTGGDSTTTNCSGSQTACGGSCVNTTNDPKNCGSCGATCGGGLVCSSGKCAVGCATGQTLCGAGTCANLQTDFDNCGTCGKACSAGQVCNAGSCTLFCSAPTTACNGSCVNTGTDNNNCGSCGKACGTGLVCSGGNCGVSCGLLTSCSTDAGTFCTNTQNDNTNCGTCGKVCAAGEVCTQGQCQLTCQTGLVNCGGKCIDPTTDGNHCGASGACGVAGNGSPGTACATGQACSGGVCSISCPPGEVACNGLCIDPKSNNTYCGASPGCGVGDAGTAGTTCGGGLICSGGSCQATCGSGLVLCSVGGTATCIDPTSNPNFCGATAGCNPDAGTGGAVCGTGQVCAGGTCGVSCLPGMILCGGVCINPLNDPVFCGATGTCQGIYQGQTCKPGHICQAGNCQLSCTSSQADCNNTCIDPKTNNQYCGASLANCSGYKDCSTITGSSCVNSVCTCPTGQVDCDNTCVNPQTNLKYCGADANCTKSGASCAGGGACTCPTGDVCSLGVCQLSCQSTEAECNGTCINPQTDSTNCGAATIGGGGGMCNSTSGLNYEGVNCATAPQPAGSTCVGGLCTCPSGDISCPGGSSTPTCINPQTNNRFCGAAGTCTGTTDGGANYQGYDCSTIAGSTCTGGTCQCPTGNIVCNVSGTPTCIDPNTNNGFCGAQAGCAAYTDCSTISGSSCAVVPPATKATCNCPMVNGVQEIDCSNTCIDPSKNNTYCGATGNCLSGNAGKTCNTATTTCGPATGGGTGYTCNPTCLSTQKQCPTVNPTFCATTDSDNNNCGTCGHVCGALTQCTGGVCVSTCDATTQIGCALDSGTPYCASNQTDNNNCGTCGNVCPPLQLCGAGTCGSGCGGATLCGGDSGAPYCANTSTDKNNCGACGAKCTGGTPDCISGSCCSVTQNAVCGGVCTNTNSDVNNCGGCTAPCGPAAPMCVAGACQACDTTNSVNFGGHCYYLDGAGGTCDPGYTLGTNAQLQSILGSNPNAWQGLNYKHTVSSNCCVLTGDSVENYGMSANCNTAGPFGAGTPVLSGAGCTNASNNGPGQLTLCVH